MLTDLHLLVESRADGRCEYCRRYQDLTGAFFFELDHIIPRVLGGLTTSDNLAFACRRCNLLKGSAIQAIDPQSGQLIRLFHPRRDRWATHFERSPDLVQIIGRTAIGRVTVLQLRFNERDEMHRRMIERDHLAELFPLD